jgi:hypothetical protein
MTQSHIPINTKYLIIVYMVEQFIWNIKHICLLLRMNASIYFSDYSLFSVSFSGLLTAKNMAKEIDKKANDLQTNKTINK